MRHETDARPDAPRRGLRLTFASDLRSVRRAQERMLEGLDRARLAEEDISSLQIVVAEVLNNIVEHAHKQDPEGRISMRLFHAGDRIFCAFVDDGAAMPENRPPDGRPVNPCRETDELPEGGFGWLLIRKLVDDFRYRRLEGRNHLALRMARGAAGANR